MEIESPSYTIDDLNLMLDEMLNHDRQSLADRLQRVSDRLAAVGPHIKPGRGKGHEWNDHEVLAHIAVLSKFWGVLVHRVSSGQVTEIDLLQVAHMRDGAIDQMAEREPAELVHLALTDHARTIKSIHGAGPRNLRKTVPVGAGATMTAEEIARILLIAHLELHVAQLERSVGA